MNFWPPGYKVARPHHSEMLFTHLREFSKIWLGMPQPSRRADVTMIGMRFRAPGGIARIAPLLMVVLFLGLGALLYPHQLTQFTSGLVVSKASKMQHSSHVGKGTPGDGHTSAGNYLGPVSEETETRDKHPLNAKYLTALLLTVFLGIALGLLVGASQMRCRDRAFLLTEGRLPSVTCSPPEGPTASLLSVFLL